MPSSNQCKEQALRTGRRCRRAAKVYTVDRHGKESVACTYHALLLLDWHYRCLRTEIKNGHSCSFRRFVHLFHLHIHQEIK